MGAFKTGRLVLAAAGLAALALGGCADMPTGPTVAVWPAPGKPFEVFRADDNYCRQYAAVMVNPSDANKAAFRNAAIGTAVGAAAGVLIGDSGRAAGVGAGAGLLVGSASASDTSMRSSWTLQRQYNIAYEQCMYSKGNQVPGAPAPPAYVPPPPPASR